MNMSRVRVLAVALTLYLSRVTAGTATDNVVSHDQDYDYDPPVAGSYSLPVIKGAPDGSDASWGIAAIIRRFSWSMQRASLFTPR